MKEVQQGNPMEELVRHTIQRLVVDHEGNWSDSLDGPYYDTPIVNFASGDDPLFDQYKQIIGPWHRTPKEAFEEKFGAGSWHGGTVISWVVPCSKGLRDSNRSRTERPSREWAQAYHFSSKVMQKQVRAGVLELLGQNGHQGVAPVDSSWFGMTDTPSGKSSAWSERHIAYVAGSGTFSLSDGFISEKGMAVALSSVVTDAIFSPNIRQAQDHRENCLFSLKTAVGPACAAARQAPFPATAMTRKPVRPTPMEKSRSSWLPNMGCRVRRDAPCARSACRASSQTPPGQLVHDEGGRNSPESGYPASVFLPAVTGKNS